MYNHGLKTFAERFVIATADSERLSMDLRVLRSDKKRGVCNFVITGNAATLQRIGASLSFQYHEFSAGPSEECARPASDGGLRVLKESDSVYNSTWVKAYAALFWCMAASSWRGSNSRPGSVGSPAASEVELSRWLPARNEWPFVKPPET